MSCHWYTAGNQCIAYPEGIPEKIWRGEHDHKDAYEGDQGIRYKEEEGTGKASGDTLFKMDDGGE